jgi:hypothetical protein
MGSTEAARRAGMKVAAIDATANNVATQTRVTASHACTPNSKLRMDNDAPIEQMSPIASPVPVNHPACRSTSLYTELRFAPSAIRTPISRVRWLTEYAITP